MKYLLQIACINIIFLKKPTWNIRHFLLKIFCVYIARKKRVLSFLPRKCRIASIAISKTRYMNTYKKRDGYIDYVLWTFFFHAFLYDNLENASSRKGIRTKCLVLCLQIQNGRRKVHVTCRSNLFVRRMLDLY